MELVKPEFGLVFWMTVSFLIVVFILRKFAWGPILSSLKERETSIEDALNAAKKAKDEVANMKAENEQLLKQARNERDMMLKEARDTKDAIVNEARAKAQSEADRIADIEIRGSRRRHPNQEHAGLADPRAPTPTAPGL